MAGPSRGATLRTLLFAPGDQRPKIDKALSLGADAVVVDLEDAVAHAEKASARRIAADVLQAPLGVPSLVMARINGFDSGCAEEDLEAVVSPNLDAVVLPKTHGDSDLERLDRQLRPLERHHGLPEGSIWTLALIETPAGLLASERLRGAPRLKALVLGSIDLAAELGVDPRDASDLLDHARHRLVVASRAAGLGTPVDGPHLELKDLVGLERTSRRSRLMGFGGRVILHPAQLEVVARIYSAVPPERIARARATVEAFRAAERRGVASIIVDGEFVDYPVYRRALQLLEPVDGRERPVAEE